MPPVGYKRVNADGSRNVHCDQCFRFICTAGAMTGINTALCVVCQADAEGTELTPEQVRELTTIKVNGQVVSIADAFPEQLPDPMQQYTTKPKDTELGRVGYYFRALTNAAKAAAEVIRESIPASSKIAREKRQPRVFERPLDDPDEVKTNNED